MRRSRESISEWLRYKEESLSGLFEERLIGYLDPGAEAILEELNKPDLLMTTSSCIGRITVVEGEDHWSRRSARVVYKTHGEITVGELRRVMSRGFENLWLKVSGPIVHFRTPRLACALQVLSIARTAGFKHSGVVSRHPKLGYAFEVMSSIQMIAPLRISGVDVVSEEALEKLVSQANAMLSKSRAGLSQLSRLVSREARFCLLDATG